MFSIVLVFTYFFFLVWAILTVLVVYFYSGIIELSITCDQSHIDCMQGKCATWYIISLALLFVFF